MQIAFDLISDLHIDTWATFDWDGQATSPYCIVAGDVGQDRKLVIDTLKKLGKAYQAVFYIDGNDEHIEHIDDLSASYADLAKRISKLKNIVYLQDNVVVIDGVAVVGTNGWWGFDLDLSMNPTQSALWWQEKNNYSTSVVKSVGRMSSTDATYLVSSIQRLQHHHDVKQIVCVTHTVPLASLIDHDLELVNTHRFNVMGNSYMNQVLEADTQGKIHTWCFGHYHMSVDQVKHNVRFVNNCRGRGNTEWCQHAYYPKRILIEV